MVQRYDITGKYMVYPKDEGRIVLYEDYAKLESHLNGMLDMLAKLDNDLGYGLIPDEYAYDRVGEILERYRDVVSN